MRMLFLGDIVGSCGREAVVKTVPELRRELRLDYVIANGENCTNGRGLNARHADELLDCGIDVITGGNHTFQHREFYPYLDASACVSRPLNYPPGAPGHGIIEIGDLVVVNLIGRVFMGADYDDPFRAVDEALAGMSKNRFILVDLHAEATSEKQAMGWYLDGRVTTVVGTHTHVPTADARVLPNGTAYFTDVGMTGPRGGVIGVKREQAINSLRTQMNERFETSDEDPWLMGVLITAGERRSAVMIEQLLVAADTR